jgi:hypothetical protein
MHDPDTLHVMATICQIGGLLYCATNIIGEQNVVKKKSDRNRYCIWHVRVELFDRLAVRMTYRSCPCRAQFLTGSRN